MGNVKIIVAIFVVVCVFLIVIFEAGLMTSSGQYNKEQEDQEQAEYLSKRYKKKKKEIE